MLSKSWHHLFYFSHRITGSQFLANCHTVGVNTGNIFVLLYIVSLNSDIVSKDEFWKPFFRIVKDIIIRYCTFSIVVNGSVNPTDRNPLWCSADFFQSPLQNSESIYWSISSGKSIPCQSTVPYSLINVIVDNRQIEEMPISLLQAITLLSKSLKGAVIVLQYIVMSPSECYVNTREWCLNGL